MLENLRKEIDEIDANIVSLIGKRMKIVRQIGAEKTKNNLQIVDKNRFQSVLDSVKKKAVENEISPVFIENIYNEIHDYACKIEEEKSL